MRGIWLRKDTCRCEARSYLMRGMLDLPLDMIDCWRGELLVGRAEEGL